MDDSVLTPLVLLHRLFAVELLVANVALEGSVIAVSPLMDLNINSFRVKLKFKDF